MCVCVCVRWRRGGGAAHGVVIGCSVAGGTKEGSWADGDVHYTHWCTRITLAETHSHHSHTHTHEYKLATHTHTLQIFLQADTTNFLSHSPHRDKQEFNPALASFFHGTANVQLHPFLFFSDRLLLQKQSHES